MPHLVWPLDPIGPRAASLPARLVTRVPGARRGALDPLTALLLPAGEGTVPDAAGPEDCAGLWLATPFPPAPPPGAGWACNFPPVRAFEGLAEELAEVGLGPAREAANLGALGARGVRALWATVVGAAGVPEGVHALLIALRGADDLGALRGGWLHEVRARLGRDLPAAVLGAEGRLLPRRPREDGFDAVLRPPVAGPPATD